jgi:RNA polymerase sigma-70 factor (ECF subfamily)
MRLDERNSQMDMSAHAGERADRQAPERPDEALVAEALAGQKAAFAELAGRYRRHVEYLCRRFFADQDLVRDLSQECFLKALVGLNGFQAHMPFAGWIRTIAINVCYDELRRRRRRPEELIADFAPFEANWSQLVNHLSPEDLVDAAEQRRDAYLLAHRLLETLRPEDRIVLTLKESEQMSVREIAQAMGWSEAKVKIRAFRARHALRRHAERILRTGKAKL